MALLSPHSPSLRGSGWWWGGAISECGTKRPSSSAGLEEEKPDKWEADLKDLPQGSGRQQPVRIRPWTIPCLYMGSSLPSCFSRACPGTSHSKATAQEPTWRRICRIPTAGTGRTAPASSPTALLTSRVRCSGTLRLPTCTQR